MTHIKQGSSLQDRSSLLESLVASIDSPMFSVDRSYCYTSFNDAHAEAMRVLFNTEIEIGKNILDYHTVDIDRNKAKENIDRALNGEMVKVWDYAGEEALSRRYFEITHNPIFDADGNVNGVLVIANDITEKKRIEEELQDAHEELESRVQERTSELERKSIYARSLIEASLDPFITINLERQITDLNKAAEYMTGFDKEELLGKDLINYFSEPEKIKESLQEVMENGFVTSVPLAMIHRLGASTEILLNASIFLDEKKTPQGVLVAVRDLTEHLNSEKQIRRQAELLDNAHDAITLRNLDNKILYWNRGSERLYGWTSSEVLGKISHEVIFKGVDYSQPLDALKIVKEKGEWSGEMVHQDRNGKEIIVDSRWTLMYDADGNPESILVINSDITEKKKLEKQLLRAQRMESIGRLAGGMAHDLNNILTPVLLSVELLKEKLSCADDKNLLDILEKNIKRGADLIQKVLSFARGVEGERQLLQTARIINDVTKTIYEIFPKNINIVREISPDLWQITGDPTQLHQVIMNLCLNARDAMPDGGTLAISAENLMLDENLAQMYVDATIGPYVLISVTDTGTGMPLEVIDRLFEPFFTTKKLGEGTGLGLSTTLAIVKSHGGFIRVYSEINKGSTFKVFLPAISSMHSSEIDNQELEMLEGHGELIFIIDDEEMIRKMIAATVEKHGYQSIVASDGAEAIALFAQQKDEIALVILDLMMPIMDGNACIKALRKLDSKVKIIAISGLTQTGKNVDVLSSVNAFLTKPFTTQKLLETIQATITVK